MDEQPVATLDLGALGQRYASLRIVKPRAEVAMEKSLRQYGQMQPVVCVKRAEGYELVDGFKRLRASQRLGRRTLNARMVEAMTERVCKSLLVQLNQRSFSINELEEALVIQSLYREDGVKQVEIAVLFGRDKSWVSRRLALVEKLHEEIQKYIRLGLLPQVAGRELGQLPRGNQEEALACVIKHRLSSRETAKLVKHLLSRPRWEYGVILQSPWEVVEFKAARAPLDLRASLLAMRHSCRRVAELIATGPGNEKPYPLIRETIAAGQAAVAALQANYPNPEGAL